MKISAKILGESPVSLWGLSARQRLQRQLQAVGIPCLSAEESVPSGQAAILLRADYLFETRTLEALSEKENAVLCCSTDSGRAAAICEAELVDSYGAALMDADVATPEGSALLQPSELQAFDVNLRRAEPPLLEPITQQTREQLEHQLYGNSCKGITDLVTKWLWPKPAKVIVNICANAGITPNMVTTLSLVLVVLACWCFTALADRTWV